MVGSMGLSQLLAECFSFHLLPYNLLENEDKAPASLQKTLSFGNFAECKILCIVSDIYKNKECGIDAKGFRSRRRMVVRDLEKKSLSWIISVDSTYNPKCNVNFCCFKPPRW